MARLELVLAFLLIVSIVPAAEAQMAPREWLEHAEDELAGLWMRDELAGEPVGSFPTFVCADGAPWVASDPCPSLANAPEWIRSELGRQYIRMVSRQVYTYGVIFHLTGNESALARARAGTRYIMEHAWDPETGSVATFIADGKPHPATGQRTTQSLAYALVGPSFYYYLTRDAETLEYIRSVRRHIFEAYWSDQWKMLRWTNADFGDDTADRKELVAQLDQINAYMLLMLPLLEGEERARWEWCELDQAAATMALSDPAYTRYLDESYRTYFASLVDPVNGGVYSFPGDARGAKAHHWKNGYHAAEHALVGYLASAIQRKETFRLYFAFPASVDPPPAPAYYFDAEETLRRSMETLQGGLKKTRVSYRRR